MMFEVHTTIRSALRAELRDLHEETLPADYVPSFRRESAAVKREDGQIVAYVTWRVLRTYAWLDRIGVSKEWRGEGLAGQLLDFALGRAPGKEWRTYIAAHNIPSQRLFISRGFVPFAHFMDHDNAFIRFKRGLPK